MYSSINSSERKNTFLVRSRTQLSGMENFTEKKKGLKKLVKFTFYIKRVAH